MGRWLNGILVLAVVHVPFLLGWANWMWGRDHYQFFPLIVLGSTWLIWQRSGLIRWPSAPSFSVRVGIYLLLSAILFLLATRAQSDWVGLLSFLVSLWASVWYFGGRSAAGELRGPIWFLALVIPLPMNLDLDAIRELQEIATRLASGALDLRGLRHTVSGVVLRTAEKSYLVEEACSGIHSLFSAVSAMTFLAVYCRYGAFRLLLTILQTVFWVVAANAFRVFLLVFADSRWQVSLDSGWRHDALGVGTYALVLFFALSTDQLLRFIFPLAVGSIKILQDEFDERISKPWNRFVAGLLDEPRFRGRLAILLPGLLIALVYLPFGSLSAAQKLRQPANAELAGSVSAGALPEMSAEDLPAEIDGWSRGDFRHVARNPDDPFGMSSFVWTFAGHGLRASVSVDGTYAEWHDLSYCYDAIGWEIQSVSNGEIATAGTSVPHTELRLFKNSGEYAVVYFSCFDSQNTAVNPPPQSGSFWRNLRNRLATGGVLEESAGYIPPVFQVQLMLSSAQELLPHELQALEQLFSSVRSHILSQFSTGQ